MKQLSSVLVVSLLAMVAAAVAATNSWTATGRLTTQRADHTATLLPNGKVLVAGGESSISSFAARAELYDSATGTWSASGSLTTGRTLHTATLLTNGKVLVAGGSGEGKVAGGSFECPAFRSAELYDPATGTWSATGDLTTGRQSHTASLLPTGKVLVAGGSTFPPPLPPPASSAELYDPATGTWSATGSLTAGHVDHTATLLLNGKVLVAGGLSHPYDRDPLTSAELCDPAAGTFLREKHDASAQAKADQPADKPAPAKLGEALSSQRPPSPQRQSGEAEERAASQELMLGCCQHFDKKGIPDSCANASQRACASPDEFYAIPSVCPETGARACRFQEPSRESRPHAAGGKTLEVRIDGESLIIDARNVTPPVSRKVLFDVLGEPSRFFSGANIAYVWDDLGLYALEKPNTGQVIEVTIVVGDIEDFKTIDRWPKKTFTGKLVLDGAAVTPQSTVEEVNHMKKGKPLEQHAPSRLSWYIKYARLSVWASAENGDGLITEINVDGSPEEEAE
jgi:hypothetical protein